MVDVFLCVFLNVSFVFVFSQCFFCICVSRCFVNVYADSSRSTTSAQETGDSGAPNGGGIGGVAPPACVANGGVMGGVPPAEGAGKAVCS